MFKFGDFVTVTGGFYKDFLAGLTGVVIGMDECEVYMSNDSDNPLTTTCTTREYGIGYTVCFFIDLGTVCRESLSKEFLIHGSELTLGGNT